MKKEDGVEFGVLRWGGGMEDVLGRLIFSVNCGVAWRALDDKLRRSDERAAACGDMELQEKMTLKFRTEGAVGRSPSCAVAPIIMEMDDDQRNSQKREFGACLESDVHHEPWHKFLVYGIPRVPSASHGPTVPAPTWLIVPRPSTGPFLQTSLPC